MTGFFSGVATAMVTPFFKDGKVNFDAFGKMIEHQISGGVDALVILGTTGEPSTMVNDEEIEVIKFAKEKIAGRAKMIVGTGSNCTEYAIFASKQAERLGADGILVVTPYYNKCTQNGVYEYYKDVAESVSIPVIVYNVPGRTGVNILPSTMAKIAEIPNIAGIKEASGNMAQVCDMMKAVRGKCDLYSGEDKLNLAILAIGGTGVISVVSNIIPADTKEMVTAALSYDMKKAQSIQEKMLSLIDACFIEVNPIPVKEAMNMIGFEAGYPRKPLTVMEEGHKEVMKKALSSYGLEVR